MVWRSSSRNVLQSEPAFQDFFGREITLAIVERRIAPAGVQTIDCYAWSTQLAAAQEISGLALERPLLGIHPDVTVVDENLPGLKRWASWGTNNSLPAATKNYARSSANIFAGPRPRSSASVSPGLVV